MNKMVMNKNVSVVLDHLLDAFGKGQLAPGEWINAARIAADLGLSRGPVREAFAILYGQGVIDFKQNHGAALADLSPYVLLNRFRVAASIIRCALNEIDYTALTPYDIEQVKHLNDRASQYTLDQPIHEYFLLNLDTLKFIISLAEHQEHNVVLDRMNPSYMLRFLALIFKPDEQLDTSKQNHQRIVDSFIMGDKSLTISAYEYQVKWLSSIVEKPYEYRQKEFYEPISLNDHLKKSIA